MEVEKSFSETMATRERVTLDKYALFLNFYGFSKRRITREWIQYILMHGTTKVSTRASKYYLDDFRLSASKSQFAKLYIYASVYYEKINASEQKCF